MRKNTGLSSFRGVALLLFLFIVPGAGTVMAHTSGKVEKICPLCDRKFSTELDFSGTQIGMRLDLKPLGPTAAPWRLAVCPECRFVLFKDKITDAEKEKFRAIVAEEKYKRLAEDNNTSYFLLAYLQERSGADEFTVANTVLMACWQAEDKFPDKHKQYLEKTLSCFQAFLSKEEKPTDKWKMSNVLAGEILRQLSRFDEAEKHFKAVAEKPGMKEQPYRSICAYELELARQKDPAPKPLPRIELTKEDIQNTPDYKMLEACPALKAFTEKFDVTKPSGKKGHTYGVYFFGQAQWSGQFTPKAKSTCGSMADLIFPIGDKDEILVGLTPEQVESALKKICDTPFVKRLIENKPDAMVRLRAAGDRLHWETKQVKELKEILQDNQIDTPPAEKWMSFILHLPERKGISFYYPQDTDIFVIESGIANNPEWIEQYEKLTGDKVSKDKPSRYLCPVVDGNGTLRLLKSPKWFLFNSIFP